MLFYMNKIQRDSKNTLWLKNEMQKATGKWMKHEDAERMLKVLKGWTGSMEKSGRLRLAQLGMEDGAYIRSEEQLLEWKALAEELEKFLDFAPQFPPDTPIYRGVDTKSGFYLEMLRDIELGRIRVGDLMTMGTSSHWSSNPNVAKIFGPKLIFVTKGVEDSASAQRFNRIIDEAEVMVSKDVEWVITNIEVTRDPLSTLQFIGGESTTGYKVTLEPIE